MGHSTTERSAIWRSLKAAGWEPPRKFVQMSLTDLQEELEGWEADNGELVIHRPEPAAAPPPPAADAAHAPETAPGPPREEPPAPAPERPQVPVQAQADPRELPGQRINTQGEEPIRVDEDGRLWFQEEVRKPAFPKPRGRRILRYNETGVKTQTVQTGEYTESFEVAGEGPGAPAEIKITLPSYQVGIYKDPRFPFRIHCYNGTEGFDLFEVENYYGAAEMVPPGVKRIYVENHLCYDIRSVVRAIQAEHRQFQLTGRI